MPPPSPRSFQVESPLRAKVLLLAVVAPLGFLLTWLTPALIHEPTISAIIPFSGMLTAVAVFLWPRRLVVGRDGVALEGFLSEYLPWQRITSVRVERGYRASTRIALVLEDGASRTIEPHWDVDAPLLVAEMESKRRAFAAGEFEGGAGDDPPAYRVASIDPHLRVLVDPRNAIEARVAAARTIASLEPARGDEVLGELLEDTADPRARRAFARSGMRSER